MAGGPVFLHPMVGWAARLIAMVGAGLVLTSCGIREIGFTERCADVMTTSVGAAATNIDVTARRFAREPSRGLGFASAEVEGVVTTPSSKNDVAMHCEFHDGVLTAFAWMRPPPQ